MIEDLEYALHCMMYAVGILIMVVACLAIAIVIGVMIGYARYLWQAREVLARVGRRRAARVRARHFGLEDDDGSAPLYLSRPGSPSRLSSSAGGT